MSLRWLDLCLGRRLAKRLQVCPNESPRPQECVGLDVCPLKATLSWRSPDSHNAPQPPRWHRAVLERQRGGKLGSRLGSSLDSQAVLAQGARLGCGQAAYDAVFRGLSLRSTSRSSPQTTMHVQELPRMWGHEETRAGRERLQLEVDPYDR